MSHQVYPIPAGVYLVCDAEYFGECMPTSVPLTRVAYNQFVLLTVLGGVPYNIAANIPGLVGGTCISCDYGRLGIYPEQFRTPKIAKLAGTMRWFTIYGNGATISHDGGMYIIVDGKHTMIIDTTKRGSGDRSAK